MQHNTPPDGQPARRRQAARWLLIGLLLALLVALPVAAASAAAPGGPQTITDRVIPVSALMRLLAPDGAANDYFGYSVAMDGDTAIVGASANPWSSRPGAAYVFVRSGTGWTQQTRLLASDGAVGDHFGASVAIAGGTVIVGAYQDDDKGPNSGSAYVFVRSGTTWTQQQKLTAADGAADDCFGASVAISGDTAIVGAYQDDDKGSESGSAYVFVRSGTTWTQQQKLTAADGAGRDSFGASVAISGDTSIIGARDDDTPGGTDAGSAYIFVRSGTMWTQQQKLTAADGYWYDYFGIGVAIAGDTAMVGSIGQYTGVSSAYIFVRSGTVWTQQQRVAPSGGTTGDRFGVSVAISGDIAIVGASHDDTANGTDSGSAYIFVRSNTTWTEQQKLVPQDGLQKDYFGCSVALSGGTGIIGAWGDDTSLGGDDGAAYVVLGVPPPRMRLWLDSDGDGWPDAGENDYTRAVDVLAYKTGTSRLLNTQAISGSDVAVLGLYDLRFRVPIAANWSTGAPGTGLQAVDPYSATPYNFGLVPWAGSNSIAGIVYDDTNENGVFDFANWSTDRYLPEEGVAGVTVKAYAASAATTAASAVSDSQGRYRLNLAGSAATAYRLEFANLPAGYSPSVTGADNPTTVAFAGKNSNVNFGIHRPADYRGAARLAATRTENHGDEVLRFDYMATNGQYAVPQTILGLQATFGNTNGLAWQASSDTLFVGAYFGGYGTTYGGGGGGGIYKVDNAYGRTTSGGLLFVNLDDYGVVTGPDSTGTCVITGQGGMGCFHDVGSRGLGDLDLSPDGAMLYVVSPYADQVVRLAIGSPPTAPASAEVFTVPRPPNCPTDLDFMPSALGVTPDGLVYVGATCVARSTQNAADLHGYVYEWNPAAAFPATPLLDFALNYPRTTFASPHVWQPWAPTGDMVARNRSPLLADVGFDFERGDLALTIADTFGFTTSTQTSPVCAGDILRACATGGGWVLENAGACGAAAAHPLGTSNNDGPGNGEYYWDDDGAEEDEVSAGLSTLPGYRHVALTGIDLRIKYSALQGVDYLDQRTGQRTRTVSELFSDSGGVPGKAAILGDLEALWAPPALEIGSQVWHDANANGIQDAGEAGIGGVTVRLTCGADSATATTASGGRYAFSNKGGGNAAFMGANEACTLSVAVGQAPLSELNLTTVDAAQPANGNASATDNHSVTDVADSDATLSGGDAIIAFTTGGLGENNHGLDFGFGPDMDLDFGDLPDAPYATLLASDGARHTTVSGVQLGAVLDAEVDGQPSAGATGDDAAGAVDDEDGVIFLTTLAAGRPARIQVTVSAPDGGACLSAWNDFDGDGTLDAVAYTAVDDVPGSGIVADLALTSGVHTLTISVPATATGVTPARFRLTDECSEGGASPSGPASSGEVEDYALASLGGYAWLDADRDGQQDGEEPPAPDVTVRLLDGNGNPVTDAGGNPITTVTDGAGHYAFTGLPAGSYIVEFVPPVGYGFTVSNVDPDASDSDADEVTGRSGPVTLNPGETNATVDAGLVETTGKVAIGDLVFCDANGNATFDASEDRGQGGVSVRLYSLGADGLPYTADDALAAATATDGGGSYLFVGVTPGQYYVAVVPDPGWTATCGTRSSAGGGGDPDLGDHDGAGGDDGVPGLKAGEVVTGVLHATVGGQTTADTGDPAGYADNSAYMTVDFGFTERPTAIALRDLRAQPVTLAEWLASWLRDGLAP